MKILIAGARSALGSRVAALLRDAGHEVVGLSRTPSGADLVTADVLDADAVRRAVDQVQPDAIVQTLNALPKQGPRKAEDLVATARLRIDGTRNLLAAARESGVGRYVAENFCFVYGPVPVGAEPLTEDHPIGRGTPETRSEDEQVRDFGGVVLRCGLFYGPGVGSTESLADLVRRRRMPVMRGAAATKVSHVHIDDAASAVVAALERGRPGEAYNVADDEPAGMHDFVRELARQLRAPAPLAVPPILIRTIGGAYAERFLSANLPLSNGKARAELRWAPAYPTLAEGLRTLTAGRISSPV